MTALEKSVFKIDRQSALDDFNSMRPGGRTMWDGEGLMIRAMSSAVENAMQKWLTTGNVGELLIQMLDRLDTDRMQAVLEHVMNELDRRRKQASLIERNPAATDPERQE